MATTTATITITSSDISDNSISISNTATLTKAGSTTGLNHTSGLRTRTLAATTIKDLINLDHYEESQSITEDKAAKVYIKNVGTATDEHVKIGIGNIASGTTDVEEIGHLYGGDWMFFPYAAVWTSDGHTSNQDVWILPSSSDSVTVEYMIIYE
jgi:hypothetical protein